MAFRTVSKSTMRRARIQIAKDSNARKKSGTKLTRAGAYHYAITKAPQELVRLAEKQRALSTARKAAAKQRAARQKPMSPEDMLRRLKLEN